MTFVPNFNQGPYSGIASPTQSLEFPAVYDIRSAWHHMSDCPESEVVLGVNGQGDPITVDLDTDSPHILVSAGTGGGKSVIMRSVAAQMLKRGGIGVILDAKRHSHRWAKNLPNVGYAATMTDIGNALVELGRECHRRNQVVDEFDGPIENAPVGPRMFVAFEELNATMSQLKELSKRLPRGEYTALDAFNDIIFMGRAAKIHVIAVAQYATCEAMGGGDIRENFSTRVLIRYSDRAWKMLTDVWPPQPAPEEPGRGMTCRSGKARRTQFLYLTEAEAKAMARAGLPQGANLLPVRRQR